MSRVSPQSQPRSAQSSRRSVPGALGRSRRGAGISGEADGNGFTRACETPHGGVAGARRSSTSEVFMTGHPVQRQGPMRARVELPPSRPNPGPSRLCGVVGPSSSFFGRLHSPFDREGGLGYIFSDPHRLGQVTHGSPLWPDSPVVDRTVNALSAFPPGASGLSGFCGRFGTSLRADRGPLLFSNAIAVNHSRGVPSLLQRERSQQQ